MFQKRELARNYDSLHVPMLRFTNTEYHSLQLCTGGSCCMVTVTRTIEVKHVVAKMWY
jgi:hypothetical protein